jgi:hypothetical protein
MFEGKEGGSGERNTKEERDKKVGAEGESRGRGDRDRFL